MAGIKIKRMPLGCSVLFNGFFLLLLVVFFFGTHVSYKNDLILLDHGEPVTATVTRVSELKRKYGKMRWNIQFTYAIEGVEYHYYKKDSSSESTSTYQVGDTEKFLYDPANPRNVEPANMVRKDRIEWRRNFSYVALALFTISVIGSWILRMRKEK